MDRPILNALEGGGDAPEHPMEGARQKLREAAELERSPELRAALIRVASRLPDRRHRTEGSVRRADQGLRLVGS